MKSLHDVPAPAKLNLFLHVTGRRADGMHLLQSAFMLVDWCDTLHFELRAGGNLSREDLGAVLPADDLVLRAARALKAGTGTDCGAHIAIDKQVPSQAGMGGGSSDAATCLLALNRLWRLGLGRHDLARIGATLGADVPFFLFGRNAWAEGTGDELSTVAVPAARFAVAWPGAGLDTAKVFRDELLKRNTPAAIISGFAANPHGFGANDLQPVAQRLCPAVGHAVQWLASQGLQPRMTGSGSAVFALMPPGKILAQAPSSWRVRECSNMEVHPLAGWAPSDDSVGG